MSAKYLSVNDGELVPLDTIKRIGMIDQRERESLASLGPQVDPEKFNTRIETADGKKAYAPETVNDIASQGVGLIQVDDGAYVPAANVLKAKNLTSDDRAQFEERTGRALADKFSAQVETKAGRVLSTITAEQVLDRRQTAVGPVQPPKSLEEVRDTVMEQATPAAEPATSLTRDHGPSRDL